MWNQAREPASPFSAGHQLAREYLGKHAGEAAHPSSMAGIPILSSNWGVMREDMPLFHAWPMTPPSTGSASLEKLCLLFQHSPNQGMPGWKICAPFQRLAFWGPDMAWGTRPWKLCPLFVDGLCPYT